MKICPQCKGVFPDDSVFCLEDGNVLNKNEDEASTVVQAETLLPNVAANECFCTNCGARNEEDAKFCSNCAAQMRAPEQPDFVGFPSFNVSQPKIESQELSGPNSSVFGMSEQTIAVQSSSPNNTFQQSGFTAHATPQPKSRSGMSGPFAVVGTLILVLLVGGAVWYLNQPHPAEAKLSQAITENRIVAPADNCAVVFYKQLKADGVGPKILGPFEERLIPILTEKSDEILKTVAEPGVTEKRLQEWNEVADMMELASEIRPGEKKYAARAKYMNGRVKYLAENKDGAVQDWKEAAELDKTWGLPLNGIGLVFNEKKQYDTARDWLLKAVEREPRWPIPYNNIGTSYFFQKRFDDAAANYRKALEFSPRWARPHAWLASIAMETGDFETAIAEFEAVLAPGAVGASELNLATIRKQLEQARAGQAQREFEESYYY